MSDDTLYVSTVFTERGGFTSGIEGPACDAAGNLYAVNYARQHTIGKVTPDGKCSVFLELPNGSIGNGIRFNSVGDMLIADYTNHNILRVDMRTREIRVHAHEPTMNQPNDICIGANDLVYASDPNWGNSTGQIWRIGTDGAVTLLETGMGTTNGVEVSPDERTLYVNETVQRNIWAYDLSPTGEIRNKRLLIRFEDFGMDGMRCDVDGNLYVTRWGKGTVAKVSPAGEVLREIVLTGKNCTNIAFGGPDGRTCYVTVADNGNVETFRVERPGRSWKLFQERGQLMSQRSKLRHVVLFKFKEGTTAETIAAIEEKFRSLPGQIEAIKGFEWGTDASVEGRAKGFTHCFLVTFDDPAGRDAYLPHPAHRDFGKLAGPAIEDVLVFDYIAKE